jgi:hypothetical protein
MKKTILALLLIYTTELHSQTNFTQDPSKAIFSKTDITNFWAAFDNLEKEKNPFVNYLEIGTVGLKDFIPYRIESASNLLNSVKRRKDDYEIARKKTNNLFDIEEKITSQYLNFKHLYSEAVFPPVYFVIGAFNAGGGVTENGIIIGTELSKEDSDLVYFVIHELIHFNQKYDKKPIGKATLLEQSIREGSADFLASLILKREYVNLYAENHKNELYKEFVNDMNGRKMKGWLYGSKESKDGRPGDLGYWMGYKITEAFYMNATDKNQAIREILNIKDFNDFFNRSEYMKNFN